MKITKHYITFPFYVPRVCCLLKNWKAYLYNYLSRRREPGEYVFRDGFRMVDPAGTLAGTIAVVFIRREYGVVDGFQTIVDIGANMGSFTVYAAKNSPKAKIFCYEPEQGNFASLTRNIAINSLQGRVTAFQNAVASTGGPRDLARGLSPLNSLHATSSSGERQTVMCTTLQDILKNPGLGKIDLLKMNCEGAEYEIFQNCAQADLERISNIRLEYHILDAEERNGEALRRLLERRGYSIQRFTHYKGESGFIWAHRK